MNSRHAAAGISPALTRLLGSNDRMAGDETEQTSKSESTFEMEVESRALKVPVTAKSVLKIGLIDCFQFTQECMIKALESIHLRLVTLSCRPVQDCVVEGGSDLDMVIYHWHTNMASETVAMQKVASIRQSFPDLPIIVLSDAEDVQQPKTIRNALKTGVHGFISTRTSGIEMVAAAIRFVMAGGIFAPLDQLLTNSPDSEPATPDTAWQRGLTSRQMAVLSHVQQGKANKIIAHELSVSESAVKVHVRNIMRKMGVTNRTQAASKAQKLWDSAKLAKNPDL
jgi:DNA-binding NarL/FixJ family response regulator